MTRVPLVSVVVPTHNRSNMLKRALDSVLAQTFDNFELIVVSDASTDRTEGVVNSYGDERIRYLRSSKPRGASAARNLGILI